MKEQNNKKPKKEIVIKILKVIGLGFLEPVIRLATKEESDAQIKEIWFKIGIPVIAFASFLGLWSFFASSLKSDLGELPGPSKVWEQAVVLWDDHVAERAKEDAFYERQEKQNARILAAFPDKEITAASYTGKPTFIDQIFTSLKTVFAGFLLGALIALPFGIIMGLSKPARIGLNPGIQILKPVSPVVWLLIVTMVVSALITSNDLWMPKAFIISFISVALCAMWPILVNTSVGVSSVDKDFLNVAKVLQLSTFKKIFKVILPASVPMIFTGLRVSLSIAWMVLIAIELLAQNPGLGKFVWDEFQNGSTNSNAKIVVAMFVIGIIGFVLDKLMVMVQKLVTFDDSEVS